MIKFVYRFLTGQLFNLNFSIGGGQQQPTTQTVQQTNLPAWAQPYSEEILGKAQALTDVNQNPYETYSGQRLAGFTPMQQQAFQNISGMQVSPQTGQATGLAGLAGLGSMGAGQGYMNMATNPAAIQAFMSPYQQNVTDWQKQQAVMDYGRALPGLGARAAQSGAFGGSRQALVESEAQRNLQNQLAGIQAQGSQNAFNAAQQAQQFGAGLGLQGYGQALQSANTLGQLGQQQYGQQMGITSAQQQAGAQQQAMEQQGLTNQYQDYLNRQNYPYQQLGFMSDILHGTPTGGVMTAQTYQAQPSMWSNIAGLGQLGMGIGALSKSGFFGAKKGGEVKGYAGGGDVKTSPGIAAAYLTDHMDRAPNPQETFLSDNPPAGLSPELLALIKANQMVVAQERQQPAQMPTSTVAQDVASKAAGLAGMPAPVLDNLGSETAYGAHGGIVAFAGGEGSLVGEAAEKVGLDELQRQRVIAERQAARDAARAAAEAAGKPAPVETIGQSDVALDRAKRQAADRLARAKAGLGSTPEAAVSQAGKTAAELEIEKMLGKGAEASKPSAAEAPKPTAAAGAAEKTAASAAEKTAASAAEKTAASAAEKKGLKSLMSRASNLVTPKSLLTRAGLLGAAGMTGYELGEAANRAGAQDYISGLTEKSAFGDAGAQAVAPSVPRQISGDSVLNVIAKGETGAKWDDMGGLAQVVSDTNASRSYGSFGFNSQGGKNSSVGKFAAAYPDLKLKGEPGTAEFTTSWKAAVARNPEQMAAAQKEFVEQNFVAPVSDSLSKVGIPSNVAKDPRVIAYFADRNTQYGGLKTPEEIKNAWAESKGNIASFLTKVNEADTRNVGTLFKSALEQGRYSEEGHATRLNKRLMGALNVGAPTATKSETTGSMLDKTAEAVRGARNVVVGAGKEFVSPGSTAAEEATATQMRDPSTGKIVNVPQLGKPAVTAPSPEAKEKANSAFAQAEEAAAKGNKVDADKYFRIGMALLASGSATLGARGAEAQGFGPLAAGIKAGVPVYAGLAKQDKEERIAAAKLAESERAHRASEANTRYRIFESGLQAAAKRAFPTFDTMTPDEQIAAQNRTRLMYLKSLPPQEQRALGITPEFLRQMEESGSAVPAGNRIKFDVSGNPIK